MTREQIADALTEHGRCHTFDVRAQPDGHSALVTALLDEYVSSVLTFDRQKCFRKLGDKWKEVTETDARHILTRIIAFDLAYGLPDIDKPLADTIRDSFLALFDQHSRYFTNGTFDSKGLTGWTPLSDATFDSGVVVMDSASIGLLWVEDED